MKKQFQAAIAAVAAIRFMAAHARRTGLARALAAREALASCLPPDDGRAPTPQAFSPRPAACRAPRRPRPALAPATFKPCWPPSAMVRRLRCQSILPAPDAPPAAAHSTAGATARHGVMRK